ncbi:hypothetical protein B7463_g6996, partial [Scytalidium lignicola]
MRVDFLYNNNKQQLEEGSEEGSEEESEEGSEEVFEESSEDSSEEDQEGSTVRESSRVAGKKPVPLIPKLDLEPVQVLRVPSLDLNPDSKLEDNVEQVLMATSREVKIIRPNLFYKDKKKLKVYFA